MTTFLIPSSRSLACALLSLSLLGCGQLSMMIGGKKATSSSASSADSSSSSSASSSPAVGEAPAHKAGPSMPGVFTDKDEGSTGPLQDAHDGEVVFAHVPIERGSSDASVLVTKTRLDRPLFVRAFLPKTPAALFHAKGLSCTDDYRRLYFFAKLAGSKHTYTLFEMELAKYFPELRTKTMTDLDGDKLVSIVPTAPFAIDGDVAPELFEFVKLASEMKTGENAVDIELHVGCNARGAKGRETIAASKGRVMFDVKPGDLGKLAKRIKVRPGSPPSTKRLEPRYASLLVPGAKLLDFAADGTSIRPMEKKETSLRIILRNADKTCSYTVGRWVEPYVGGGQYDAGGFEGFTSTTYPLPCP